jgi:hypothetical protein
MAVAWQVSTRQSAASQLFSSLDSDQAIVGIAGSVTAFRERGFIASLL